MLKHIEVNNGRIKHWRSHLFRLFGAEKLGKQPTNIIQIIVNLREKLQIYQCLYHTNVFCCYMVYKMK